MELLERVLHPVNLTKAMEKVISNSGCAGIDGMEVSELCGFVSQYRDGLISAIRNGTYQPQAVMGIEIPKISGGVRKLGIPTAIDRMIQQAIHQVLCPMYDFKFSPFSFGFRPNKSAHKAISRSLHYINSGYRDIIDLDLKSFFDVVNHDYLMSILYRRIKDERLLRLIRKYLNAGMMMGGVENQRELGTPQGSPLSPLLSNILLNELDQELESRGHRFVRYADDCSIFLKSKAAAKRVLSSIKGFIEQELKLLVNNEKTSICRPVNFHSLGYNFISTYKRGESKYRLRVSPKRFTLMVKKVKEITRKQRSLSITQCIAELNNYLRSWIGYFRYAFMKEKLKALDTWVRRRLRYCIWKHWKKPNKRMRSYIRMGVPNGMAYAWSRSRMGGWAIAGSPIMRTTVTLSRLKRVGYMEFADYYKQFSIVLNPPLSLF